MDHKPLLSIFGSKKGIPVYSANRLQRWATTLLGYDFSIRYKRTEDFGKADGLSRLIGRHHQQEDDTVIAAISFEGDVQHELTDAIRGIPVTASEIRAATATDPTLRSVMNYLKTAWPLRLPSGDLQQLQRRRESLTIVDGCLMSAERVIVPATLRPAVLRQFHSGHPGIGRMKAVARSFAYWPGIDQDIEDTVKRCSSCQQAAKSPVKHEPLPWKTPAKPWSRIHADFAGPINGSIYLIVVDAYSKWPEIISLHPATSASTISALKRMFSQHGLPEVIVTDNGSQFTSAEFADFCTRSNIQHVRTPPYHPQSNGQAERFVDTFKRAALKAHGEGTKDDTLQAFLLAYRTTPNPNASEGRSPAELLMGRQLRTVHHALIPTKSRPDPLIHEISDFKLGEAVFARDYRPGHDVWAAGKISGQRGKVVYEVEIDGDVRLRHRNQLRPRKPDVQPKPEDIVLPLDILLDTFTLPTPKPTVAEKTITPEVNLTPRRWTDRRRRPTTPFQLNTRSRTYRN